MASENETVEQVCEDIAHIPWNVYTGKIETSDEGGISQTYCTELSERTLAAHKREVEELRKCLKEAIDREGNRNTCYPRCAPKIECRACVITKWRKALEGVQNNEVSGECC